MVQFENTRTGNFENAVRGMREPMQSFHKMDSRAGIFTGDNEEFGRMVRQFVEGEFPEDSEQELTAKSLELYQSGILNKYDEGSEYFLFGRNDLDLAQRLLSAGSDSDSKFLRQIDVSVEITGPSYWLSELDTYKVSTVRNSSSLQHKGAGRMYKADDFGFDHYTEADLKTFDRTGEEVLLNADKATDTYLDAINELRQKYVETGDYRYFRLMRQMMPMSYKYTVMWSANYAVLRNIYRQRKNHMLTEWNRDFCGWIRTLPYAEELITFGLDNK